MKELALLVSREGGTNCGGEEMTKNRGRGYIG